MEQAEAALAEHYPRLVRLAYVTLPGDLGKHRRALAAHRLVQRALPTSPSPARQGGAYGLLRHQVLCAAMEFEDRGRLRAALEDVRPPLVMGLRVHPRSGVDEELALYRALAALPGAEARAAYALMGAEGLGEPETRAVLDAAGARDPREAVRAAAAVRIPAPARPGAPAAPGTPAGDGASANSGTPLGSGALTNSGGPTGSAATAGQRPLSAGEFDACTLQIRPTDLLRRRRRNKIGAATAAVVAAGALLVAVTGGDSGSPPYAAAGSPAADPHALDPAAVVRVPAAAWKATTRMDFSAWPARGSRVHDSALLGRALAVWANPGSSVDVSATPGTPHTGPAGPRSCCSRATRTRPAWWSSTTACGWCATPSRGTAPAGPRWTSRRRRTATWPPRRRCWWTGWTATPAS